MKFWVSYGDIVYFKQLCLVKTRFTGYISPNLWGHCVFQAVLACKDWFYIIYFSQFMETYQLFFRSSWCCTSYYHKNKLNVSRINDLLLFLFTFFLVLPLWIFAYQIFSNIENIFDRIYFYLSLELLLAMKVRVLWSFRDALAKPFQTFWTIVNFGILFCSFFPLLVRFIKFLINIGQNFKRKYKQEIVGSDG